MSTIISRGSHGLAFTTPGLPGPSGLCGQELHQAPSLHVDEHKAVGGGVGVAGSQGINNTAAGPATAAEAVGPVPVQPVVANGLPVMNRVEAGSAESVKSKNSARSVTPPVNGKIPVEKKSSSAASETHGKDTVHFSELLGPLKKFLQKRNINGHHSKPATPTTERPNIFAGLVRPASPVRNNTAPPLTTRSASSPGVQSQCTLKEKYGRPCQLLGKGANGNCFLVRRYSDDKVFAVKEFRRKRESETQREYMKKLTNEYCIGTLLHHQNVVETLDIIFEKDHCYEVMELCEGGDLFEAISSQEMSKDEADCVFAQLIHGVAYLHAVGVCHRDLKPENCLFDSHNHLKIIDFGSADVVKTPFESTPRRSTGRCGSGPYMAPEEFSQPSYDGRKVDVWACAVIYLAMIFRRFPWQTACASDANYAAYVKGEGKCKFFERLPEGPRALLRKMLEPDPDKRMGIEAVLEDKWFKGIAVCDECITQHHHGKAKGRK
ncbi:serine/threonine-protein kinase HAL4/sat4 [Borealophlyctis nickersoniae]|nr:serine/threonine-protein kinase HAL4/sat4 [Borealophlyctis nickersoniae]